MKALLFSLSAILFLGIDDSFLRCKKSAANHSKIIGLIKQDLIKRTGNKADSLTFVRIDSYESIQFENFIENIIEERYSKGARVGNSTMPDSSVVLDCVFEDSLKRESKRLHEMCGWSDFEFPKLAQSKRLVYLFFSKMCNNLTQVTAVHSESVSVVNGKRNIYGMAFMYLFKFSGDDLINFYSSVVEYN